MRVGFDIDGVLANFEEAFLELLNRKYGTNFTPESLKVKTKWNFSELDGITDIMEKEAFKNLGTVFWLRVNPYDKLVMKTIALLAEKHNVYFITDRAPNPTMEMTLWQTRRWIENFGIHSAGVILTGHKADACHLLELEYFIDDKAETIDNISVTTDTKTFLLKKSYNAHCKNYNFCIENIWEYIEWIIK